MYGLILFFHYIGTDNFSTSNITVFTSQSACEAVQHDVVQYQLGKHAEDKTVELINGWCVPVKLSTPEKGA